MTRKLTICARALTAADIRGVGGLRLRPSQRGDLLRGPVAIAVSLTTSRDTSALRLPVFGAVSGQSAGVADRRDRGASDAHRSTLRREVGRRIASTLCADGVEAGGN